LSDFRCYGALTLAADDRPAVVVGPNGAGKTNLLEALSFLVPGRGLRRARLTDVSRRDADRRDPDQAPLPWAVAATVAHPGGTVDIGTGLAPAMNGDAAGDLRRRVRIDGIDVRGQAALGAHVRALWLTPEMDRLFVEGASSRRRFLDRLVLAFDVAHGARLGAYERALRERSRLLRDGARHGPAPDPDWLGVLEEAIAGQGIAVAAARADLVRRLNVACAPGVGPFPAAYLALSGAVEDWLDTMSALDAEECFRDALAAGRGRDGDAGGAATGPHRSDLQVTHVARGVAAASCSTGEQKALLISITFGAARLQALEFGAAPLLLLDEIAAHLDEERRRALFDEVAALETQVWMTGTDQALFAPMGDRAQYFRVENARIAPAVVPAPV
jgi:DNA replication and repair protein RecF